MHHTKRFRKYLLLWYSEFIFCILLFSRQLGLNTNAANSLHRAGTFLFSIVSFIVPCIFPVQGQQNLNRALLVTFIQTEKKKFLLLI